MYVYIYFLFLFSFKVSNKEKERLICFFNDCCVKCNFFIDYGNVIFLDVL